MIINRTSKKVLFYILEILEDHNNNANVIHSFRHHQHQTHLNVHLINHKAQLVLIQLIIVHLNQMYNNINILYLLLIQLLFNYETFRVSRTLTFTKIPKIIKIFWHFTDKEQFSNFCIPKCNISYKRMPCNTLHYSFF